MIVTFASTKEIIPETEQQNTNDNH